MSVETQLDESAQTRYYQVQGQVFFSPAERLIESFDIKERIVKVIIDVSNSHF